MSIDQLTQNILDDDFCKVVRKLEKVAARHDKTTLTPRQVRILVDGLGEIGKTIDESDGEGSSFDKEEE